jgi:hypothetical protein
LQTVDAGHTWTRVSPDLTGFVKPAKDEPAGPDAERDPAISTVAASPVRAGVIWAGTSNRIVQLTEDGGAHWKMVTPPGLVEPDFVKAIECGRHDAATAYVTAGDSHMLAGAPYIVRTHDSGKTWQTIVNGIPPRDSVEVVREDPKHARLLYAATTTGVFVSHDDGDHWESLQLNLPHTIVSDLDVHGDDLVASTYGRSLWILDGLTPIREDATEARLFRPATAIRARWDNNQDTPYPPETPAGENPPDGAIVDYYLKSAGADGVTLTITDRAGSVVRRLSSNDKTPELPLPNVPGYWFRPDDPLPAAAGWNRLVWDLRGAPLDALPYSYGGTLLEYTEYTLADHAIPGQTPRRQPLAPIVPPGTYTLALTVNGETYRQSLTVRQDPRVPVAQADLDAQWELERKMMQAMKTSYKAYYEAVALQNKAADEAKKKQFDAVIKGTAKAPGVGPVNRDLARMMSSLQGGDVLPSNTVREAIDAKLKALADRLATLEALKK